MSKDIKQVQAQIRNLLVEHEIEPFIVMGYKGQDELVIQHMRGLADTRAMNCLVDEKYREWFCPDEVEFEYEGDWDE